MDYLFSVAFWVKPEELARDQNFIGRHTSGGADELLIGLYGNQYRLSGCASYRNDATGICVGLCP